MPGCVVWACHVLYPAGIHFSSSASPPTYLPSPSTSYPHLTRTPINPTKILTPELTRSASVIYITNIQFGGKPIPLRPPTYLGRAGRARAPSLAGTAGRLPRLSLHMWRVPPGRQLTARRPGRPPPPARSPYLAPSPRFRREPISVVRMLFTIVIFKSWNWNSHVKLCNPW